MSAIIPLPEMWRNELCFECKFLFERGDERFVPAVVLHVMEPLFEGSPGPTCAPLCGHHAEMVEVDGVIEEEWNEYLFPGQRYTNR